VIKDAHRTAIDTARRVRPSRSFLSLIVIRVLLMAVPAVFLISMTRLSLLFVVVPDDALALTRRLGLHGLAGPGWDVGDAASEIDAPARLFRSLIAEPYGTAGQEDADPVGAAGARRQVRVTTDAHPARGSLQGIGVAGLVIPASTGGGGGAGGGGGDGGRRRRCPKLAGPDGS
jgi:hypothetical protein